MEPSSQCREVKKNVVTKVIRFDKAELAIRDKLDNVSDSHRLASPLRTQTPYAALKVLLPPSYDRVPVMTL